MPEKEKQYEGRPEFNEAWANATRKIHIEKLAQPAKKIPWPNPLYTKPEYEISPSALKYKASKRIKLMSQCKPSYRTEKYKPLPPEEHVVSEAALKFIITPRLNELSNPIKKPKPPKAKKSAKRKKLEQLFMQHRQSWLALRGAPRQYPPPPKRKRGRKPSPAKLKQIEQRINELAVPVTVTVKYKNRGPVRDIYEVPRAALKAKASDRTKELAEPKVLPEEAILDMQFKPFCIKRAALKYTPTEKILKLAIPFVRTKKVDTDLKEDPYSVPKRALKAKCSKRTKELAQPVRRE